eukprot:1095268-Pelagomonas_calceolata.AAC.4
MSTPFIPVAVLVRGTTRQTRGKEGQFKQLGRRKGWIYSRSTAPKESHCDRRDKRKNSLPAGLLCAPVAVDLESGQKGEKLFWRSPPFRGDTRRALPQGASPIVWGSHTRVHTRPLRLTHSTSGSEIWNAPKTFRRLA